MVFRQKLLDLLALLEYFYVVWFDQLKSSLGRNPKLKKSIEDLFKQDV